MIAFPKPKRWQSKKYRDAARGQDCTLRLPGCTNNTETVILAHHGGAGMGNKNSDHDSCDCCFLCHQKLDRPDLWPFSPEEMEAEFQRARLETIVNRIERGVIK